MRHIFCCIAGLLLTCHVFAAETVLSGFEAGAARNNDAIAGTGTQEYYIDQTSRPDQNSDISVKINPADKRQVIEGWGGSLCWWANIMGGYPDARIKQICNWITSPVSGLNMNIFRFNIGGGDARGHTHMRADGGNMPGYKDSLSASYNWKSDANQRKMLQQLIASRIANTGVNDVKIIGFSNSPPWWMTVSGCTAGSTDGTSTNLKADMFDDFADYLTDVTRYYHDSLGVTFSNLEPFNEPFSTWWKALGGQEGCYFTQNDQHIMLRELYAKLQQKNMLSYCTISAMDANSIDEAYKGLLAYKNAGDILPKLTRIDVHSYAGTKRTELATLAAANNLNIWQSESGPLYVSGTEQFQMMTMCDRIIADFRDMNCKAWIDWQLASDGSQLWGLLVGNYKDNANPVSPGMSYYLRVQFSRYLKAGYRIIYNNSSNVLTAISPDEKELVIVVSNSNAYTKRYNLDLSSFSGIGSVKKVLARAQASLGNQNIATTFSISGKSFTYDALSESACTFIVSVNLSVKAANQGIASELAL
jgi:O-glycosyl hydrolase